MKRLTLTWVMTGFIFAHPAVAEITRCTAITAIPTVITSAGIYCLQSDLSSGATSGEMIDIQASYVTIDLNGHMLDGRSAGLTSHAVGIGAEDRENITVRNGTISGFEYGVRIRGTTADVSSRHLLEGLHLDRNYFIGAAIEEGSDHIVRNNQVVNNGHHDNGSTTHAIKVASVRNTLIAGNVISGTSETAYAVGIDVSSSSLVEVRGNSIYDTTVPTVSSHGISVGGSSNDIMLIGNRILNAASNGTYGVNVVGGLTGIVCIGNTVAGFTAAHNGCTYTADNHRP